MPVASVSRADAGAIEQDLIPLSIAAIRLIADFPCDLYRFDAATRKSVLYRGRNLRATAHDLNQLLENGEEVLYVKGQQLARCQKLLEQQLEQLLERDDIPPAERLNLLVTLVDQVVKRS